MQPMSGMKPMSPMKPMKALERWWPEELGEHPNSAGVRTKRATHSSAIESGWPSIQAMAKSNFMTPATIASPASSSIRAAAGESDVYESGRRGRFGNIETRLTVALPGRFAPRFTPSPPETQTRLRRWRGCAHRRHHGRADLSGRSPWPARPEARGSRTGRALRKEGIMNTVPLFAAVISHVIVTASSMLKPVMHPAFFLGATAGGRRPQSCPRMAELNLSDPLTPEWRKGDCCRDVAATAPGRFWNSPAPTSIGAR